MENKYYPTVNIQAHVFEKDRGGIRTVPRGTVCEVIGVASKNGDVEISSHLGEFSVSEMVFNKWFLPVQK